MRLAIVESPFAGRSPACVPHGGQECRSIDAAHNLAYAKALCRFLSLEGMAPYASHLFCTQFLDDTQPLERSTGIEIGLAWGARAELTVVGIDRGISSGMRYGIDRARAEGRPVAWLSLRDHRDKWLPTDVDRAAWRELVRAGDQVRLFDSWATWAGGDDEDDDEEPPASRPADARLRMGPGDVP